MSEPTQNKEPTRISTPFWETKFDIFSSKLGLDGEQMDELRQFIRNLLSSQLEEVDTKIMKSFGLEVGDLPAFPQKGIDIFGLLLELGKHKITKSKLEEVEKVLPKERNGECVEPDYYIESGWRERDVGFNTCLELIKEAINKIK